MNEVNPNDIPEALDRDEGTISFTSELGDILGSASNTVLLEITSESGDRAVRLEYDKGNIFLEWFQIRNGRRRCEIDISDFGLYSRLYIIFTWNQEELQFFVGPAHEDADHDLRSSSSGEWIGQVRRDADGNIVIIGGPGVEVTDYYLNVGGQEKLRPTAKEIFDLNMSKVDEIINIAESQEYYAESILSQQVIVMMVTALETYLQERFVEVGNQVPDDECISVLATESQFTEEDIRTKSVMVGSVSEVAREHSFNFQDISEADDLYNSLFDFDLECLINETGNRGILERNIQYRHKIVHGEVNTGILNFDKMPKQDPVFSNTEHVNRIKPRFVETVEKIHTRIQEQ